MGSLSSASGVALIVPAYFVCAGILLFASLTAAVVGLSRGRYRLYSAFAATCFFSACLTLAMAAYYLSESVGSGVEALRWASTSAILLLAAIPVFVALFTDARDLRRWLTAVGALSVVFIAANYLTPYGLRYESIQSAGWIHLPWGESLFHLDGTPGWWNLAFRICAAVVVAWAVLRLVVQHKKGDRREAAFLAAYLVIVLVSSVHGALIDRGIVRGFHSIGFALVGLAFLMGVNLVMRLREQNVEIAKRAYSDALTGLPNRVFMQEHLERVLEDGVHGSFGAVLQCNLDHFKVLNDALTHKVGDELLREVARRLAQAALDRALLGRMGGDEFIAVIDRPSLSEADAGRLIRALAEDISVALKRPVALGDQVLTVSASTGIATFAMDEGTASAVMGRADMALHQAKSRGRNTLCEFVPALQEKAEAKYRLVEGLRRAVSGNELQLHYQPQVDWRGEVIGAEALLRWSSPQGDIGPAVFIPVAEETGLIHMLGEWSLRNGCERLAAWTGDGAGFSGHLSVNVSPWQLARPDFVAELKRVLDESRIDPARLTLEITESAVLYDVKETVAKLSEIRPLGVRISLDDFGTGYSSLALIKDLPLDAIKIDQSFVRHLSEGANQHLVRVVVAIGNELGLVVVAEGVETEAERQMLVRLGCRAFQGYLFCRPVPEAQFLAWLRARSAAPLASDVRV